MKLIDLITKNDLETATFETVSSGFAKAKKGTQSISEEAKNFFKDFIADDFWRSEYEKEASV